MAELKLTGIPMDRDDEAMMLLEEEKMRLNLNLLPGLNNRKAGRCGDAG